MTKARPPVSIENTLRLLLGELTLDTAAEVTGRAPGYLHNLTDPDKREQLSANDLVLLDSAHHARFGRGWPLHQTLELLLRSSGPYAESVVLQRHVVDVARESGEAVATMAEAALHTKRPGAVDAALREAEEAYSAFGAAITSMRGLVAHAHDPPDTS